VQEVRIPDSRMFVWPGVHVECGENIRVLAPDTLRVFVVTDKPCVPIARHVGMSLVQNRFDVSGGVAPPTKTSTKAATLSQLQSKLDAVGKKEVAVVAVGGTAVMHLGSKLAGSRPLFLIPTTMRSQLDVSVGGACCPAFAGRWKAPLAVFSDPTLLRDLPLREYVAGLAEAVKCAIVQDADLYEFLTSAAGKIRDRDQNTLEELVFRAASVKSAAISTATPGPGARATLRYGHWVGGALERFAGSAILHGEALAVGMEAEAALAQKLGWADGELIQNQNKLLKAMGLPTRAKGLPADKLALPLLANGSPKPDLPDSVGHTRGTASPTAPLIKAAIAAVTK
jgi:3-dehydroquinate synthetase